MLIRGRLSRKDKGVTVIIRLMGASDVERVREVGQAAWSDLAMQDLGRRFRYPKRSKRLIRSYMDREPRGCLVAEVDGRIVGSAFCHVLGGVGWIGPLEVLPDVQNAGVGKALLSACEHHLLNRGCRVIGLETMSHLPKHLHFYLTSGYLPTSTVLLMEKQLTDDGSRPHIIEEVSAPDLPSVLPDISRISHKLSPTLDYAEEARTAVGRSIGHLFVSRRDGEAVGFAILHTYQKNEEVRYSSVKAIVVDTDLPDQRDVFDALIDRCERRSVSVGKDYILVRISSPSPELYRHMLSRSYILKGVNLKMVKEGEYMEKGRYHITSWAG